MFLEVSQGIQAFEVLLPLALILILSKLLSIGCRKIGLPQVVGMLLTGIILGLITLIPNEPIFNSTAMEGINFIAEIGVILIMFSAGIETDLKQIKATGVAATIITILGVVVPMLFGFLVSGILPGGFGKDYIIRNLFYGVILTATSVSVTVATLKELGKLNSKIGTAIVSAAILDDILGVIVLSVVISLNQALTSASSNVAMDILIVFGKTIGFFVFAIVLGLGLRILFKKLSKKYGHHRRLPIFGIAIAFFFSYAAEEWFGIADITGAFFAGLMLSGGKDAEYIERRTDIASYMLFTPVFFAKVGLTSLSSFKQIDSTFILFGFLFILAGIAGKLFGCGLGAKITKNSWKDSYRCGLGMMCRAEVCLICASKGISANIISASIQPFILCLILITSFVTPVLLKKSYKNEIPQELNHDIMIPIIEAPTEEK
ncbi:MAG: cation:proton antiporter [Anaeroplasmataceae bacterium]|nr:cation:proton antiporter [Anaeroplasmataceae bacterium]